jgi:O-antigen biosynthesis protein
MARPKVMSLFSALLARLVTPSWDLTNPNLIAPKGALSGNDLSCNSIVTTLCLTPRFQVGWYMLEISLLAPTVRTKCILQYESKLGIGNIAITPSGNRIFKRLVFLDESVYLKLVLPLTEDKFTLTHLRLVRVSERFARSRMLLKLRALHPRYKFSPSDTTYNKKLARSSKFGLGSLWTDYCAIFDEAVEVVPYPEWVRQFDTPNGLQRSLIEKRKKEFKLTPTISLLMAVYNPNSVWLDEAIRSVVAQTYTHWELCIADDASTDAKVRDTLLGYAKVDSRIKVVFRTENGHIAAASNSALALASGEWAALLDQDDVLSEHALFWVVDTINKYPDSQLIYSDEDKVDESGHRSEPYFKSDWNADLLLSHNMFSHLGVYATALVKSVNGFQSGFEGSQDHDLVLRCIEKIDATQIRHIPKVLYHWRMHKDSTAHNLNAKPYAITAGERAITQHLQRMGVAAKAESVGRAYRVRYELPVQLPLVSLIIPTRNGLTLLRRCVESILTKTTYANYEIIVMDNGSDDRASLRYLDELAFKPNVKVVRDARPFNYSALNNSAVRLSRGSVVGLVNNDIEVISPDWLTEMVSHALRPEVGAVGARLWYSDDTLQHAGVVLGINGVAGHVHRFLQRGDVGYCGRAALIQSFSAVTGACLVVRKALYEEVGGLNEVELQVACNDIDFCLRLREAGYSNIYTPYAELYHHESASRGFDDTPEKQARSAKEVAYMHQRWGDLLLNDPAYSPNLTLDAEDFSLAWPPRIAQIAQPSIALTS